MRMKNVTVLIFVTVLLVALAQLLLKQGMINVGKIELSDFFSAKLLDVVSEKFVVVGVILFIITTFLWLVILSQEELSFAYPLISSTYVVTAILASIIFHESLSLVRILGIVLIAAGAYFIILKI